MKTVAFVLFALASACFPLYAERESRDLLGPDETLLCKGEWSKRAQEAEGLFSIVHNRKYGCFRLRIGEKFKTLRARELYFFLLKKTASEAARPEAGDVMVARPRKFRGAQWYEIPFGADVRQYRTLALYCRETRKIWAVAPLEWKEPE